jgi:hypothetical protein
MTNTSDSGVKAGSPYLELPKRSEAEARAAQERIAKVLAIICEPTPTQRWLSSDHVTKTLEKFRKEDGRD